LKKIISIIIIILLVSLSTCFIGTVSAQSDIFPSGIETRDLEVGDFFEFKMNMYSDEMEMSGDFRIEVTSTNDKITVKGTQYNVLIFSMYAKGTVTFDLGITGTYTATGDMYIDKATEDSIKDTSKMSITMKYEGETFKSIQESTTIIISRDSTWIGEGDPEIGNTWTETVVEEIEEKETMITPEGEESETSNYEETTVTDHEYIEDDTITTDLGTYTCRVIKEEDRFSFDEYSLNYYEKNLGLPILNEGYYDDELVSELELTAYKLAGNSKGKSALGNIGDDGNDDEDDESLLGMGKIGEIDTLIIVIIIVLCIVFLIMFISTKRRERAGQPSQRTYIPPGNQPQHQPLQPYIFQYR